MQVQPAQSFTASQLALIQRTVARDTTPDEFNLFIETCKIRGLNPLVRHAYCLLMNKDKPDKRQMTIIISIDGQRFIAEKTGNYRPDENPTRFEIDKQFINPTNPAGIVSATVTIYKRSHGAWFPVSATAYWEEYAPIKEIWVDGKRTGRFQLDPNKPNWTKMPRTMIGKVPEMAVLRKAFPDQFSGLYSEEEMDRSETLDLTATEVVEQNEAQERLAFIGGPNVISISWDANEPIVNVPVDKFFSHAMDFLRNYEGEPQTICAWWGRNREPLKQYWVCEPEGHLQLKKLSEQAYEKIKQS